MTFMGGGLREQAVLNKNPDADAPRPRTAGTLPLGILLFNGIPAWRRRLASIPRQQAKRRSDALQSSVAAIGEDGFRIRQ
jgi:hypothetical protein